MAPRPWVTRSMSRTTLPWLSIIVEQQRSFKTSKTDSGKWGTSPRSLLKDLSNGGKNSKRDLAYKETEESSFLRKKLNTRKNLFIKGGQTNYNIPTTPKRKFSYKTAVDEEFEIESNTMWECKWYKICNISSCPCKFISK